MRAVPWRNLDEWFYVYERIFSADPKQRKAALYQIRVWRLRGSRGIPLSVECTANLTETLLALDPLTECPVVQELQLSLIATLVRMVNGFLDGQQKGAYARSITKLAEEIGMPRLLVDIRHDGTHGELPSLQSVIFAAENALSWLKNVYWDQGVIVQKQEDDDEDADDDDDDDSRLAKDIEIVISAFKKAKMTSNDGWEKDLIEIFKLYKCKSIVKEMFRSGRLIPKEKSKLSRLSIGNDQSEGYFEIWMPFLKVCIDADTEFELDVFRFIIDQICCTDDVDGLEIQCLAFWFIKMLQHSETSSKEKAIDLVTESLLPCFNSIARKIVLKLSDLGLLTQIPPDLRDLLIKIESAAAAASTIIPLDEIDKRIRESEKLISDTLSPTSIDTVNGPKVSCKPVGWYKSKSVVSLDLPENISVVRIIDSTTTQLNQWLASDFLSIRYDNEDNDDEQYFRKRVKCIESISLFTDPIIN